MKTLTQICLLALTVSVATAAVTLSIPSSLTLNFKSDSYPIKTQFDIQLSSAPDNPVTVTLSSDASYLDFENCRLTLDSSNYNSAKATLIVKPDSLPVIPQGSSTLSTKIIVRSNADPCNVVTSEILVTLTFPGSTLQCTSTGDPHIQRVFENAGTLHMHNIEWVFLFRTRDMKSWVAAKHEKCIGTTGAGCNKKVIARMDGQTYYYQVMPGKEAIKDVGGVNLKLTSRSWTGSDGYINIYLTFHTGYAAKLGKGHGVCGSVQTNLNLLNDYAFSISEGINQATMDACWKTNEDIQTTQNDGVLKEGTECLPVPDAPIRCSPGDLTADCSGTLSTSPPPTVVIQHTPTPTPNAPAPAPAPASVGVDFNPMGSPSSSDDELKASNDPTNVKSVKEKFCLLVIGTYDTCFSDFQTWTEVKDGLANNCQNDTWVGGQINSTIATMINNYWFTCTIETGDNLASGDPDRISTANAFLEDVENSKCINGLKEPSGYCNCHAGFYGRDCSLSEALLKNGPGNGGESTVLIVGVAVAAAIVVGAALIVANRHRRNQTLGVGAKVPSSVSFAGSTDRITARDNPLYAAPANV